MNRKSILSISTVGAFVTAAGSALAGGFVAPVETPAVVAPVAPVVSDWSGAYVGGSIGYAFGGDDEVGFDYYEDGEMIGRDTNIGDLEISGVNAAVHVGYRWQRNNWVFGPELWIEGGAIDDEFSVSETDDDDDTFSATVESEQNYAIGLQMKTGYIVRPGTLVYGTAGIVRGDFDYTVTGAIGAFSETISEGYTATGYSLGVGVERQLNERLSMFAEWQYRNFGKEDVTFGDLAVDGGVTRATPENHNLKLGLNFRF
ncbi:outer membrane protein [Paracoccus marinaquae]|uniref:Outer membrane beta-barrel protein n=1 Tax=Paracoccus marinaquae TaxID=2841926 RepID=A0ABS6AJZ9_9RHOB|nr:outer membrane beta-barrel protein [Paracoccus marinaquae]MBU3030914.1 outer membrane beta-barrel protein [Paracoccus marinaquae]